MSARDLYNLSDKISLVLKLYRTNKSFLNKYLKETQNKSITKIERVIIAGFLLVEHIKDKNILKQELKKELIELFDLFAQGETENKIALKIEKISLLVDLLFAENLISFENARIFKISLGELVSVKLSYEEHNMERLFPNHISSLTSLADSLDNISEHATETKTNVFNSPDLQESDATDSLQGKSDLTFADSSESESLASVGKPKRKRKKDSVKSANRRVLILNVLSKTPLASIKEIASKIPDVGTKTLQRELQQLIRDGVIEKVGEKRWTRYRII